jgi:hypothetical protein
LDIIRALTPNDLEEVARLFQKVFRHNTTPASESLKKYFQELYFGHPWYREDMPSLVYETSEGKIFGFLGVLPLHMKYHGKEILVGVGGNYMVDPAIKNPLAGPRILKKFLSGPQALSMSDTGNEIGKKMWEGLGGSVSHLQSLHWIRPLKPTQLALQAIRKKASFWEITGALMQPMSSFLDGLSSTVLPRPFRLEKPSGYTREIGTLEIFDSIPAVSVKRTLVPAYTKESLQWILQKASEKNEFGRLRSMGVFRADHSLEGWFLYYPHPGKIGQVLQVSTTSRSISNVLDHLFRDAWEMKSVALIGRMDPTFMKEFTAKLCVLFHRSNYFVMHAKELGILYAINSGDAFITRLEGEWWTRLQGDVFE